MQRKQFLMIIILAIIAASGVMMSPQAEAGWVPRCTLEPISVGDTVDGYLDTDCESQVYTHYIYYARYYTFTLTETTDIEISMTSTDVDPYLVLLSGTGWEGEILAEDDDGGDGFNALILMTLDPGDYTIDAETASSEETGAFTLTLNGTAVASADIAKLHVVTATPENVMAGDLVTLQALVQNISDVAFPAGTEVCFDVDEFGNVGCTDVSGMLAGRLGFYNYRWYTPSGAPSGSYTVTGYVESGGEVVSEDKTAENNLTISVAEVNALVYRLYMSSAAEAGSTATFKALVWNKGASALPGGSTVDLVVDGTTEASADVSGLAAGRYAWYIISWDIPIDYPWGTHTYWGIVNDGAGGFSAPSTSRTFTINGWLKLPL